MEIITKSAYQTQKLGEKIGSDLKSGKLKKRILCLFGDLGSGKTTFIQGLARGLGIKRRIISPTFVFMKQYKSVSPAEIFYHVDLYRIEKKDEAQSLGLEEIFSDPQAIIAIEWAEKITCLPAGRKEILPLKRINIQFNYLNQNHRKIIIK